MEHEQPIKEWSIAVGVAHHKKTEDRYLKNREELEKNRGSLLEKKWFEKTEDRYLTEK